MKQENTNTFNDMEKDVTFDSKTIKHINSTYYRLRGQIRTSEELICDLKYQMETHHRNNTNINISENVNVNGNGNGNYNGNSNGNCNRNGNGNEICNSKNNGN